MGDIEIYTLDNQPFEVVEVKHNVPIDKYLVFDVVKKTESVKINRYYILTTFKDVFSSKQTENEIMSYILDIKRSKNLDIIPNGITSTLKYYLRFVDNCQDFVRLYTENLINEAKMSTEIKLSHLERWTEILRKFSKMIEI
ncbi:MAG: hypothetical protein NZ455_09850 [Bacteroidia bacterium]|nr:hypothetical protein [Bacteroidia bacterium]MDW8345563.1 hypothetical protein [Bacteroidia bacterium]